MVSVEAARDLVESSRPRRGVIRGATIALLGLSMLLGAMAARPDLLPLAGPLPWLLPQAAVIGIAVLLLRIARKQQETSRLMQAGFEAMQLQDWPRASDLLRSLLRRPLRHPAARAESLLALVTLCDAEESYEASQYICESLLEEGRADPLQLHQARVALAGAMLRNGQIADAVNLIDRLTRESLPEPLRARVEMLSLLREVMLGQSADYVDRAGERRGLFRRWLSTRAAYGYALLAAAFDRARRPEEAGRCWHDATMLMSAAHLGRWYHGLEDLAVKYPAAEIPPRAASWSFAAEGRP